MELCTRGIGYKHFFQIQGKKIPQIGVSYDLSAINGMLKTKYSAEPYFKDFKETHVSMDFQQLSLSLNRKKKSINVRFEEMLDVKYKPQSGLLRFQETQHIYEVSMKDSKDILEFKIDETDDQDKFKHFLCGFVAYFEYDLLTPEKDVRQNKFQNDSNADRSGPERLKRLSKSARRRRSSSQHKFLQFLGKSGADPDAVFENYDIKLDNVPVPDPWLRPLAIRGCDTYRSELKGMPNTLQIEDIARPGRSISEILQNLTSDKYDMAELPFDSDLAELALPYIDQIVARPSYKGS